MSQLELATEVRQGWVAARRADPGATVQYFERLLEDHPDSATAMLHCARSHDFAGEPFLAAPLYGRAITAGLSGVPLRRCLASYGSTLRNLERFAESVRVLESAHEQFPDDALILCYLALALHSAGEPAKALSLLLDLALAKIEQHDLVANRWALGNYAAALTAGSWTPDGAASLELTGPLLEAGSADRTAAF